jgi:hypothetical protein
MYRKHQKVSLFFSLFLFVIFLMMASAVSFLYSNELSISILQFVRFSDVYYTGHCCGTVVQSWSIERSQLTAALPPTVFLSQFRWFPRRHKNNIEACSHLSQFEFESAFHQTVLKKKKFDLNDQIKFGSYFFSDGKEEERIKNSTVGI